MINFVHIEPLLILNFFKVFQQVGRLLNILAELVTHPCLGLDCMLMMRYGTRFPDEEKSQLLEETRVSKVASCRQNSPPTWLISAGYSASMAFLYKWCFFNKIFLDLL